MECTYESFIEKKRRAHVSAGFDVAPETLSRSLFDFQRHIVSRALKSGRFCVFAECGLGKTLMQLSWAEQVARHTGGRVIVLCPLVVVGQTIREGEKFGIDMSNIDVSNYENLHNLDCSAYSGVVLDESSILKNYEGATRNAIMDAFAKTPYKLACTATPSPNDPMELGNHAEFMGVMTRNEMLAMYFVHDGGETSKWRIKGHGGNDFYRFVSTWAVMLHSPADIGFCADGYTLPGLHIHQHMVHSERTENGMLFNDAAVSATDFNAELRRTMGKRIEKVVSIVESFPERNFIIWVKHNAEGEALRRLIHGSVEVTGSDTDDYKSSRMLAFANNEFRVLITKTKIASFGMNFQNCADQIFSALDFSFEGFYQAVRRSHRFGQKNEVNIHVISTDTMGNVMKSIEKKQADFDNMRRMMQRSMNDVSREENEAPGETISAAEYTIKQGDCVRLIREMPDESIGISVFSPPFADLYAYSDDVADMGNSKDYDEFVDQFAFLVRELYRVMKQGRNVCVHCMDLPVQKGKHGHIGLRDFSGMILRLFEGAGFIYHSRITIWKNPVVEMQRTKALGLLHKQVKKDSTMSRVGIPDYVLVFRKDGDRADPVRNDGISVDTWQKYASPVWMDIDYGNTLQGVRAARDESDEKHICPLQLGTIERLVALYSNPGDTLYTPFMGIGSEVWQAVSMGRKAIGHELKPSYFRQTAKNMRTMEYSKAQTMLF